MSYEETIRYLFESIPVFEAEKLFLVPVNK
ncbi:hypothetical protein Barb6XT_00494 [Bacteroidales bacterium Barb6XT]|nr:hypothetical protein Barb6XT_00494 [Bacteroidales bacterium Barb6XT]